MNTVQFEDIVTVKVLLRLAPYGQSYIRVTFVHRGWLHISFLNNLIF